MQSSIQFEDCTGAELLENLNNSFQTVTTDFAGGTEPQPTYPGMNWLDTSGTNAVLKKRNADNTNWVTMGTFKEDGFHPANTVASDDKTVTKKGNVFNGANQLVMLDSEGKLPTLNGSLLTNLTMPTKAATTHYLEAASDHSKILIKAGTSIEISTSKGTKLFQNTSDTEYSFPQLLDVGSPLPGKDYSMFLVLEDSGSLGVKFSLNTTAPEGYAVNDVLRIGGFHTMCLSINSSNAPSAEHPAVGFNSGEIIPNSVWDNLNRPKCSPNGMVYVDLLDNWWDIYPQGGKDGADTSVYGATAICSRAWLDHVNDMKLVGKRLPFAHEYATAAEGSPQKVAVKGAAQPNPDTTGGHMATNNKYMLSKYFIWEMCGLRWCWLSDATAGGTDNQWHISDSLNGAKGQVVHIVRALLAGATWSDSSACGSRALNGSGLVSTVHPANGGRGVCEPLNPRVIVA